MILAMAVNWFLQPLEIVRPQSAVWRVILGAFVRFTPVKRYDVNNPEEPHLSDSLALGDTGLGQEDKKPYSGGVMVKDIEL